MLLLLLACKGASDDSADCLDDDRDGACLFEDCDDGDPESWPGAPENWYDGKDQSCDGNDDDQDLDGFPLEADCNDVDAGVNPEIAEVWYDGVDQDCDGNDADQDRDGSPTPEDCDDLDSARFPSNTEVWYDGVDQDCDGNDEDQDRDGVPEWLDCDDLNASRFPGNAEVWYDGVDQDCDGNDDDQDRDGTNWLFDCDDEDPNAAPGNEEVWYDGVDGDCDGWDDFDADKDGFQEQSAGGDDCDDTDPTVNADAQEALGDGTDQDCDGDADTAPWTSLPLAGSTDLQGPRLAENADGVIVAALTENWGGGAAGGAFWNYVDPSDPRSGSTMVSGWSWSQASWSHGTGYDIDVQDGSVIEGFTLDAGSTIYLVGTATDAAGNLSTASVGSTSFPAFEDVNVSSDGNSVGIVACESTKDTVVYMQGSVSDYENDTTDYATTTKGGGQACAANPDTGVIFVGDSSSGGTTRKYTFKSTSTSLTAGTSPSGVYKDVDWDFSGASNAYTAAMSSGLYVSKDGSTTTITTKKVPAVSQVALSGSTVYAVTVDLTGTAWLYYGKVSSGFTEVPLGDCGLGATVDDADLLASSAGVLVVACRAGDSINVMGVLQ